MNLHLFINILAWPIGLVSLLVVASRVQAACAYSFSDDPDAVWLREQDFIFNRSRTFPIFWWLLTLLVCIAAVVAL